MARTTDDLATFTSAGSYRYSAWSFLLFLNIIPNCKDINNMQQHSLPVLIDLGVMRSAFEKLIGYPQSGTFLNRRPENIESIALPRMATVSE
jgi:hypothetical protein